MLQYILSNQLEGWCGQIAVGRTEATHLVQENESLICPIYFFGSIQIPGLWSKQRLPMDLGLEFPTLV